MQRCGSDRIDFFFKQLQFAYDQSAAMDFRRESDPRFNRKTSRNALSLKVERNVRSRNAKLENALIGDVRTSNADDTLDGSLRSGRDRRNLSIGHAGWKH